MKSAILALLLSAFAAAPVLADIVVLPSPKGCAQAKLDGDKVVIAACAKLAKGEKVDSLACPIEGDCKTTK